MSSRRFPAILPASILPVSILYVAALALTLASLLPAAFSANASEWERLFAPRAEAWDYFEADDPASERHVDHSAWTALLKQFLHRGDDGIMRVDYAGIALHRGALQGYIDGLATVPVRSLNRAEQFAYWVNLYNALTVRLIIDYPGVDSIRDIDISPGLFTDGPWDAPLVEVEGKTLTLNDIEHRILRPIFRDPKVHYALNCASLGCPDLRAEAYDPARLEAQLDDQARSFINHPRGARLGPKGGLHVSSIYIWFREDFGGTDHLVIDHLLRFAGPQLDQHLMTISEISGDSYDWHLNSWTPRAGPSE